MASGKRSKGKQPPTPVPDEPSASAPQLAIPQAADSGSVDVHFTDPTLAPVTAADVATAAIPQPISAFDSAPISSGKVRTASAPVDAGGSKSFKSVAKDAIGGSVSVIGGGVSAIGGGVSKVGELTHKIPLVGSSVAAVGKTISSVGESLTELPRAARTRKGRVLLRSMFVAFALVTSWIVVIVALQLRGTEDPDFRPEAESFLVAIGKGPDAIKDLYEHASPRFQELQPEDSFLDTMMDLDATLGNFKEILAVNDTLVTNGPTGRIGRVSLIVLYEKVGKTEASISLHYDHGIWKFLGVGVIIPPNVTITQAQREARVQACKDPMDAKHCDLHVAANAILEQLRDGRGGDVWDAATDVFQKQEDRSRFSAIQVQNFATLGEFRRIVSVAEAKVFSGNYATFDTVLEFANSNGVRAVFGFYRNTLSSPWKLRSFKVVLPMPRAEESGSASEENGAPGAPGGEPDAAPAITAPADAG